jgi:hypothetical protein
VGKARLIRLTRPCGEERPAVRRWPHRVLPRIDPLGPARRARTSDRGTRGNIRLTGLPVKPNLVRRFLVTCLGEADEIFRRLYAQLRELGCVAASPVGVINENRTETPRKTQVSIPRSLYSGAGPGDRSIRTGTTA